MCVRATAGSFCRKWKLHWKVIPSLHYCKTADGRVPGGVSMPAPVVTLPLQVTAAKQLQSKEFIITKVEEVAANVIFFHVMTLWGFW